jgi:NAD(P)-dependent dehydrogenase (short-subunit alcohol dehydrogenase family)
LIVNIAKILCLIHGLVRWGISLNFITSHHASVTGSSTGFGRVTVEKALTRGDRVVATLRTPSQLSALREEYSAEQLLILPLDVTSTTSVREAFNKTRETFGYVDIVLSNAGITMGTGEAESVDEDTARRVMETNFWGSRNVALEAIKFFRDTNQPQGGLLLGVSSTLGVVALPAASYYSAA